MRKQKDSKLGTVILVIFALCVILPLLTILVWTVTERWSWPDLIPQTFSLRAICSIFKDGGELAKVFLSSILISLAVAVISVAVGTMTARALEFYDFKGKGIFTILSLMPFVVPATVFVMGIHVLFLRMGLGGTFTGVIFVHVVCSLPYAVMLMQEGTRAVGIRLEEQARVLGAGPFEAFFRVTFPNLLPVMLSAFSMSYIVSFSQYFLTLIIGGGKIKTFTIIIVPFLAGGQRNFASVYSVMFVGITLVIFGIFEWIVNRITKDKDIEYYA